MKIDNFILELRKMGINLNKEQLDKLEEYYKLLIEYNEKINLTSIIDHDDVYLKHFYDSLTLIKICDLTRNIKLCDIGSGAGFPGIVLKIVFPNLNIVLVDSLNKRINFLNIVIKKLKLTNIIAVHDRIEEFSKKQIEQFDVVTARAVASISILLEISCQMIKIKGNFIAMKAKIENEVDYRNALNKLSMIEIEKINFLLPIENSNRTLIKFQKLKSNLKIFPRKYSEIKKKTL